MFIRGSVGVDGSGLDLPAMPRRTFADDYEDDEEEDREAPEAFDRDDDDDDDDDDEGEAGTVDCPRCGREISEYAERCPRCGAYVSEEEATRTNFPVWVIVAAVALLVAIAVGWWRGVF
jgi:hypothetical protein